MSLKFIEVHFEKEDGTTEDIIINTNIIRTISKHKTDENKSVMILDNGGRLILPTNLVMVYNTLRILAN